MTWRAEIIGIKAGARPDQGLYAAINYLPTEDRGQGKMSDTGRKRVLIVDDDPTHLDIYGMIVDQAGFFPVRALVRFAGLEPVQDLDIAAILLDYRLNSVKTAPEIAQELTAKHPQAPILVLSDLWSMPADIAPYAYGFVRKGEPRALVNALHRLLLPPDDGAEAENGP